METLITVYWVCFGLGVVYIAVTGALGMVSHGMEGAGAGHGDIGAGHGEFDAGHAEAGLAHDIHAETTDTDAGGAEAVDAQTDAGSGESAHGEIIASHDVSAAAQGLSTFTVLSPLNIAGFLAAFGGTGLLAAYLGVAALPSIGLAMAGGVVMALLLWLVIGKWLFGMQGSSQAHQCDMIGLEAEVLTPVEHEATGEIAYVLEGTRYTAPARLIAEGRVEKRQTVRIRKMLNNIVYVEEKKKLLG